MLQVYWLTKNFIFEMGCVWSAIVQKQLLVSQQSALCFYMLITKKPLCVFHPKLMKDFAWCKKSSGIFLSLPQCALRLHNSFIGLQWDAKPGFKFRPFLRNALRNAKIWFFQGELGNKSIVILDNTSLLILKIKEQIRKYVRS